jgi:hypothetical protein
MAWQFEHSAVSNARAEDVWPHYADVEHWSAWSQKGVEWSRIDGPFKAGTQGKSKPPGFPAGKFRLTAVEPQRMFASETKLPGARLAFEHVIESVGAGVQITHRARVDGPMAWLWTALVRRATETSLPDGVDRLARMAEAGK